MSFYQKVGIAIVFVIVILFQITAAVKGDGVFLNSMSALLCAILSSLYWIETPNNPSNSSIVNYAAGSLSGIAVIFGATAISAPVGSPAFVQSALSVGAPAVALLLMLVLTYRVIRS